MSFHIKYPPISGTCCPWRLFDLLQNVSRKDLWDWFKSVVAGTDDSYDAFQHDFMEMKSRIMIWHKVPQWTVRHRDVNLTLVCPLQRRKGENCLRVYPHSSSWKLFGEKSHGKSHRTFQLPHNIFCTRKTPPNSWARWCLEHGHFPCWIIKFCGCRYPMQYSIPFCPVPDEQ